MNKKYYFLPLVIAALTISGCQKKADNSSSEIEPIPDVFEQSLTTSRDLVGLFTGETYQLRAFPEPGIPMNNLEYTSMDENIATVDKDGVITGVSQGVTKVIIRDLNRHSTGNYVEVQVVDKLKSRDAKKIYNNLDNLSKTEVVDNFVDHELYEKTIVKNGVVHSYDFYDQEMTYSKEEAYFGIKEMDIEMRVEDGSYNFANYRWLFYTNSSYDTYTFHEQGIAKNYYVAPTQAYIGQPRTAPLLDLLDNLFTSGKDIFSNAFNTAGLANIVDLATASYTNLYNQRGGSTEEGSLVFGCTISFEDSTADQDTESRYGIPYGTPTPEVEDFIFVLKNNKVVGYAITAVETYTIGEDEYEATYQISHAFTPFDEQKSQLVYPDKEGYTRVDTLFDV